MKRALIYSCAIIFALIMLATCTKGNEAEPDADRPTTPVTPTEPEPEQQGAKEPEAAMGYIPINWAETKVVAMDMNSGIITLEFKSEVPVFHRETSVFVLETDSIADIRVVKDATINGKTVVLKTEQGGLEDLFMDTGFTLSTEVLNQPVITKSGALSTMDSKGVIHPSQISVMTDRGLKTVYDINSPATRAEEGVGKYTIFDKTVDMSGQGIFLPNMPLSGGAALGWEKFVMSAGLNSIMEFRFGSKGDTSGVKRKRGDLEYLKVMLNGYAGLDSKIKLITPAVGISLSGSVDIPKSEFSGKFRFPVGGVTVVVDYKGNWVFAMSESVSSELTAGAGFNISRSVNMGFEYDKKLDRHAIIPPIPATQIEFYPLTVKGTDNNVKLGLEAAIYPDAEFTFYKLLGGIKTAFPQVVAKAEYQQNNKVWTSEVTAGVKAGFAAYFGKDDDSPLSVFTESSNGFQINKGIGWGKDGFFANIGFSTESQLFLKQTIYEAPKKIELVSPDNGIKVDRNIPLDVTFKCSALTSILGIKKYSTVEDVTVFFEAQDGTVEPSSARTSSSGEVKVKFTPQKKGATLTASIKDIKDNFIDEVVFAPEVKDDKVSFDFVGNVRYNAYWQELDNSDFYVYYSMYNLYNDGTFKYYGNTNALASSCSFYNRTESYLGTYIVDPEIISLKYLDIDINIYKEYAKIYKVYFYYNSIKDYSLANIGGFDADGNWRHCPFTFRIENDNDRIYYYLCFYWEPGGKYSQYYENYPELTFGSPPPANAHSLFLANSKWGEFIGSYETLFVVEHFLDGKSTFFSLASYNRIVKEYPEIFKK